MELRRKKMNALRPLVKMIYRICTEELSSNCREIDHIEYIEYRLQGGELSEDDWFLSQAEPIA